MSVYERNEYYTEITGYRTEYVTVEWKEDMFSNEFANKIKDEISSIEKE